MITIFILIYLVSLIAHFVITYKDNKYYIRKVGDLIDHMEFFMWFPLVNTLALILFGIVIMLVKIVNLLRLPLLWEKFRNIKLK